MKLKDVIIYGFLGKKIYDAIQSQGCPKATKDIALNTKNRQIAIEKYLYGAPNPSQPSEWYWKELAKKVWNIANPNQTQLNELKTMRCSNCSAFDISPRMKKCLPPDNSADDYDVQGLMKSDKGTFGYCWMHHFKCRSDRTCATWAGDKAIVTNKDSYDWQQRYG